MFTDYIERTYNFNKLLIFWKQLEKNDKDTASTHASLKGNVEINFYIRKAIDDLYCKCKSYFYFMLSSEYCTVKSRNFIIVQKKFYKKLNVHHILFNSKDLPYNFIIFNKIIVTNERNINNLITQFYDNPITKFYDNLATQFNDNLTTQFYELYNVDKNAFKFYFSNEIKSYTLIFRFTKINGASKNLKVLTGICKNFDIFTNDLKVLIIVLLNNLKIFTNDLKLQEKWNFFKITYYMINIVQCYFKLDNKEHLHVNSYQMLCFIMKYMIIYKLVKNSTLKYIHKDQNLCIKNCFESYNFFYKKLYFSQRKLHLEKVNDKHKIKKDKKVKNSKNSSNFLLRILGCIKCYRTNYD